MTTAAKDRLSAFKWEAAAQSLEAKLKLLSLLPYHPGTRRKHTLVFGFVLDWYHSKYGDALASVRHIVAHVTERDPFGGGLYAEDVHSALTDLVAWQFLQQEKGAGRRASRYIPNWELLRSVREIPNAKGGGCSVLESPNAGVLESPNATPFSVHESPNEDPSTPTRTLDPGTDVDRIDSAVPSAPPVAAALGAAPVGASEEERFTVLFRAYGVLLDYDGGITAFRKLAPSAELYDDMLQAAVVWRSAWQAGGDAKKGRRQIKTWIEKRDFLCDPPERRPEKPAKAPKPKKASRAPVNDNSVSTAKLGAQPRIPRQVVTIERVEEVHLEDRSICRCVFALENGETITRDFCVEADDQAEQEAACKIFDVFADAAGVDVSESTKGLKGARFTYSEQNGTGKYEALAEAA